MCTFQCAQVSLEIWVFFLALCFGFCGDEGFPVLSETPEPEAKSQTRGWFKPRFIKVTHEFGFLCFRDSVAVPRRWATGDLQVLILKRLSSDMTKGSDNLMQGMNSSSAKQLKGPDMFHSSASAETLTLVITLPRWKSQREDTWDLPPPSPS